MEHASSPRIKVAAFYRFVRVPDPAALRSDLLAESRALGLRGTVIVAAEGVNGTIAGSPEAVDSIVALLDRLVGTGGMELKFSHATDMPFHRMKVRLKREIVTMGLDGIDAAADAGTRVSPHDWNRLISDPATVVVDTRNDYEVAIGTFERALDPQTASFRAFPSWVERNAAALAGRKVAMFCTGGIRCEKATAYLRSQGFDDVYHLAGGILKYLEEVPAEESLWRGECFVFDERVAVSHGLAEGEAELCRACRRPLTADDRLSPLHVDGVACLHCHEERSAADRARYAERQRQVELAERRGGQGHIGERPRSD